jgi:hypothetical protein
MKNKTLTLTVMAMIVFIAITIQIQAQSGDSKKWTTEQAVDFVACSFVRIPHPEVAPDCVESLGTASDLKKRFNGPKTSETRRLIEQFQVLKDDISGLKQEKIYSFLTKDVFSVGGPYDLIAKFVKKREDDPEKKNDIGKLKEDVKAGLSNRFYNSTDPVAVKSSEAGNLSGPTAPSPSPITGVDSDSSLFSFISWDLLVGLGIGVILVLLGFAAFNFIRGRGRSSRQRDRESRSATSREPSSPPMIKRDGVVKPPIPSSSERKLQEENEGLRKQLAEKEKELQSLKASIPTPEVSAGYVTPVIDFPQPEPVATSSAPVRSLYFPAPTPEGLFDSRYASSSRIEGESLYVLRLISEVEAEVEFDNSRISVNKARNSPEQILDPVCEGARSPMNQILGIRMTAPGKARLEGDDWRVYEKVKLTYEY